MKQVINGKLYNTETARRLAHFWNNRLYGDFDVRSETLYVTKKGTYFLACENGCRAGGQHIRPLTEEEAREWTEAWANESYCDIFGEPEEA